MRAFSTPKSDFVAHSAETDEMLQSVRAASQIMLLIIVLNFDLVFLA